LLSLVLPFAGAEPGFRLVLVALPSSLFLLAAASLCIVLWAGTGKPYFTSANIK
jgi:hypothetical protein